MIDSLYLLLYRLDQDDLWLVFIRGFFFLIYGDEDFFDT